MAPTWRRHWGRSPEKSPLSSPVPETQALAPAQVSHSSSQLVFASYTLSAMAVKSWLLSPLGVELDWSSDVRRRIQESSYIQEQYVLTRCSLSSERSLQTQSHSHIHASSNSDSAGGALLSDPHSSGSVLDTGSLPQGLEKMPPPEHRSSLSRWADSAWQQNLSAETPDSGAKKARLFVTGPKALGCCHATCHEVLSSFFTLTLRIDKDRVQRHDIALYDAVFGPGWHTVLKAQYSSTVQYLLITISSYSFRCMKEIFVVALLFLSHNQSGRLDGGEESRRRQKALARSTMAARSFSSPQGELEMHRLRRALERVSFDQTLGGRLDESDGETKPPSRGTLSRRSLTDSSKTLLKKIRIMLPIFPPSNFCPFLSHSDHQMGSSSLPLPWTGTASQIPNTSSLLFHQRIPHQASAAHSSTGCWVAGLCPGRSLLTWGTSGPLTVRRHQRLRDAEEEEGERKEEEENHGKR